MKDGREENQHFNKLKCFVVLHTRGDWLEAMKSELDSIGKNNTWRLVELPHGHRPIGLKWVFKLKKDVEGKITKQKARLVAKGYIQQKGVDFDEVFAPVHD